MNRGEMRWISILRGALAIMSIFTLGGFGVYKAIVIPLSGMGTIERREYGVADLVLGGDYAKAVSNISWNVVLIHDRYTSGLTQTPVTPDGLAKRVTAEPGWIGECTVKNVSWPDFSYQYLDAAVVSCSPPGDPPGSQVQEFPEFFITVNFTDISPPPRARRPLGSVHIFVGTTTDVQVVIENTEPTFLFPGSNIIGVISPISTQTFIVANVAQTSVNPFTTSPVDPNISTIRFILQGGYGECRVIQDVNEVSFLAGLSAVGGLGSLLSTLLAIFLGTSLMRIVIRMKPNSPFGYIHNLGSVQRKLASQCEVTYPGMKDDIRRLEEKPGILAYLLNTLIDVEPLGYGTRKIILPETVEMNGVSRYAAVPGGNENENAGGNL